ncbi:MAG: 2-amino-4-hydroxy-6-hydroxymethyldihydropteridine diphosphokinase [Prevotellaceae bacterium]|jgi:2-amino-4-hydroxy-6-hydroxymethyldihydropteridine diphosphokinase|nr:2-amino-4-hydroxy-6-hydroxymethyldihydropteridine diphosphokinase [Prevotellaceae bacterium]
MMTTNNLHAVYLLAGSNMGDRAGFLRAATRALEDALGVLCAESSILETEPWGFSAPTFFLNRVLFFLTPLSPLEVLEAARRIENENGRIRPENGGYASRTLDIDILFYDDAAIDLPELQIPHPRLHERGFALALMREVAPLLVHPTLNLTMERLFENFIEKNNSCWFINSEEPRSTLPKSSTI